VVALLHESKGQAQGLASTQIFGPKLDAYVNDRFVVCVWKMGYRKICAGASFLIGLTFFNHKESPP